MLEIGERTYTICGPPMYIAPEVCLRAAAGSGLGASRSALGVRHAAAIQAPSNPLAS